MIRLPSVQNDSDAFAFGGGTDIASPALRVPPGSVIESQNYEPDSEGGYSRPKGYERFDGRTSPSSATYFDLACTLTTVPAAGAAVTIGAATALFVSAVDGGCILTGVVGTIPASTTMTSGGSIGTTAASIFLTTPITPSIEAQRLVDSAEVYRALISPPTGSGAVRGVCLYAGVVYAFRDNVGGTACVMWKSTAAGWVAVALNEEVSFTNAALTVNDGDTLTQGAVTATIQRVVVETGTLASGVNTGRLIISGRAGGNYTAALASATGAANNLTLSGAQTAITLTNGGRYVFDIANFYGQASSNRLYGASGVDRCFEFDGTVFVPLRTGASPDKPSFIKEKGKYLYVGQGASLMNGSVGNPYRWVASEGAVENAVGDTITGLAKLPGKALAIMCRNSSFAQLGSSTSDWVIETIRADVGAVPYTLESMSDTYFLDDRGITSVAASQEYGNFTDATLSKKVQAIIDSIRGKVVGSFVSRQKGHYVLLMNDGATLTMGVNGKSITGIMSGRLDFIPSCVFSGEDTSGIERIFIGATNGSVYEMNKGSTFDGAAVEAYTKIFYNNSRSPMVRKHYRSLFLEMTAALYAEIKFRADLSYGDPNVQETEEQSLSVGGTGGTWDYADWDGFFWDSQSVLQPRLALRGSGTNIALLFYSKTTLDFGHSLQGATVNFTPRRKKR